MAELSIKINADGKAVVTMAQEATNALKNIENQAAKTSDSFAAAAQSSTRLSASFADIGKAGVVFAAAQSAASALVSALASLPASGIKFAASMEVANIGMAGILASMTSINGQATSYTQGLQISSDMMKKLQKDAMQTAASTQELVGAFQALIGPSLAAGMSLENIRTLTTTGVNAVKSMGMAGSQVVQELRDLVQGGITASSSTLATALGLKDADIAAAKASSEGLFTFLMDRMQGFAAAGPAYAQTFSGAMDQLFETITTQAATVFEPVMTTLKTQAQGITETLGNSASAEQFQKLTNLAQLLITALGQATQFVIEHAQAMVTLVQVYGAFQFGLLVSGFAATTAATLEASAASRLATIQAQAEGQANTAVALTTREKAAAYLQSLQASAAAAEATAAETTAKIAFLQAGTAGLALSRAETIAKLANTQSTIAQAQAQHAAATAAGAQSFALALVTEATTTLTVAQVRQTALVTELAALGRQQASVSAAITAATQAQTLATNSAAIATERLALVTTELGAKAGIAAAATTGMGAVIGALGGPVGIAIAAVVILISKLLDMNSAANQAAATAYAKRSIDSSNASGIKADEIALQNLTTQIQQLKQAKFDLYAEKNTPGVMAFLFGNDYKVGLDSQISTVEASIKGLQTTADGAAAIAVKTSGVVQLSAASATSAIDKLLEGYKTADSLKEKALKDKDALDTALKQLQANQSVSPEAALQVQQKVAAAKLAIEKKLQEDLKAQGHAAHAAATKTAAAYTKELDAQATALAELSGYSKDYAETMQRYRKMLDSGTLSQEAFNRAAQEFHAKQPGMITLTKAQTEASKESAKADIKAFAAMDDLRQASEKQVTQAATMLAQIEFETTLLAMNTEQRAQATMERDLERQGIIKGTTAYDAYITKLREAMAIKSGTEAGIKATEDLAKASQKAAEESSKYWEDALMRAFESGKGFFQSLWDTIKNTLKTQVLKVSLQAIGIGDAAGGAAAADGIGEASSFASSLSKLSNAWDSVNSASGLLLKGSNEIGKTLFKAGFNEAGQAMNEFGNGVVKYADTINKASDVLGYATAIWSASQGKWGQAAGQAIGTYFGGPLGAMIGGEIGKAVDKLAGGETRVGGEYRSNITDGAKFAYGPSGGDAAASQVKLAIDTTTKAINDTLKAVGSAATLTGFAAGYETSDISRGGAYAGATLSTGAKVGQDGSGDNYQGTKYDPTKGFNQDAAGAVKALDIELKQSIIETLQAAGDIPQAVTKVIDDALARANVDSVAKLSAEATESTMAALNTVIGSVEIFNNIVTTLPFKDLADLSFDAAAGLIEFSGGIDNLASNLGGFYSNFYAESEQLALKTEFASKAFSDLGQVMPAVDGSMRDWYKSLINTQLALDQSDPAIAKATAGLLGMQGAVNELAPAFETIAVIKSSIAGTTEAIKNQTEWQTRLDTATRATTDREVEKATALLAADDATDALINRLYALEDAAALASRKTAIIDKYTPMTLDGAKAALPAGFADAFAAMGTEAAKQWVSSYTATLTDPAAITQVEKLGTALDTLFASMDASEARLKGFADEAANLSIELLTAQGNTAGAAKALRELETKGFNAAEIAAYDYNQSLRNQIMAINDAKAALKSFNTAAASIRGSQDTIDGTSPIDAAQRELTLSLNTLNAMMKKRPDIVTTTAATSGSAAVGFFEMFPDALAYLKNFATTQAADFNAYVGANAELIGQSLDSPAWANRLYDLITTNGNETIRAMGESWINPDDVTGIVKAAVVATAATTTITPGAINSAFVPFTDEQARAIGAAIAAGTVSATDYTTEQINALQAFMSTAATLTTAQNTAATSSTADATKTAADATKTADAIQAITDGLTKEGKSLNIALLEAQGNMTGAAAAAKLLATEGMNPLQIGLWEANELVKTQTATLVQHNTLQDELNGLRDTEAQAITRQRDALDASNRALFDQVQGFKTLASLQSQFSVPQTATQASASVSAAGYNVTGMDTSGIASYITGILNAPGMLTSTGDLTAAGLSTVATLNSLTDALKILGTEGDKAAEQVKTNAATKAGLQDQLNVLNGNMTQSEVDRANTLEDLTKAGDTASISLQKMVWGIEDLQAAAEVVKAFDRAMLEASGNTAGLEAFDKAVADAALITAGWTQAQVDKVNTTSAATKLTATNKDLATQLNVLTGKSTQQQIDRQNQLAGVTEKTTLALMNQVFAQQDLNLIADERKSLESELLTVQEDTTALRKIELAGIDASNRSLKLRIWALQDEKEAQDRYTKAVSERDSAQSAVDSIRESATSNYLSAQEKAASAQQRIADITASALKETAQKAFDAATKMRELGKSLREFVESKTLAPNQSFAATLKKALAGDQDAMANLSSSATDASTLAAERAGNVALAQARIMASVMQAATLAEASALPTVPADADPMIAATADLATAQTELADALRVANAIGASTTRSVDALIGKYATAQITLADAIAELATAAAALDAIKANTAATAVSTDNTATNTTGIVPAVTELEASLSAIQLTANATIDFIVGSTLPDDLKNLALGGARQIDATVSFFQGAKLTPDVLKLATAAATDLYHTINFVVGSTLPNDLKTLAITNVSTLAKTVDLIVGSALPNDLKALALGTTSNYITTVTAVLASNTSATLKNLVLTGVGDYTAMVRAAADPAMPSALRSVIFDGAGQYISTISAITSSTMNDAQKTLLLNTNSAASRIVTIEAALSNQMTAAQQAILNASSITITKTLNTLVTGGSFTAAQLDILNAATGAVTKTLNTVATGSLTADQLAVYNATTQAVTKTFNATATGSMTQDQKNILGIVTGATNGSVVISGTATFEPSTAHKELLKQQAQGLLLILQELKTQGTKSSIKALTLAEQVRALAGLKGALGYPPEGFPFASGGQFSNSIVSSPTYFNMGLMGEAGPEAIMPLKRTPNGDLGVQMIMPDFGRYGRDSGNDALVAEIRALRQEVAELRQSNSNENRAIATHTANTADSTRRMDTQGVLVYTDPAEPLLTEVAP
jgi:hypothetical protein